MSGAARAERSRSTRAELSGWCPFTAAAPSTDDEYFEVLTAAVFEARFSAAVVRVHWPSIRSAFADFSLRTVAVWPDSDADRLLDAPGIIRNRKKILATLRNARDLLARAEPYGSVHAYLDAFRPDADALARELDEWAHYIGAPSIRWFIRCARIAEAWVG
jgi:DNA-3-methyladenine glycosylase I